eukprot:804278-Prorocentrum_minimum.AAC.3
MKNNPRSKMRHFTPLRMVDGSVKLSEFCLKPCARVVALLYRHYLHHTSCDKMKMRNLPLTESEA